MRPIRFALPLCLLALAGCLRVNVEGDPDAWARAMEQSMAVPVRVATYNTSLYSERDNGLVERL